MEHRGGIVDGAKSEGFDLAENHATHHAPHRETPGGTSTGTIGTESRSQTTEAAGEDEKGKSGLSSTRGGHARETRILLMEPEYFYTHHSRKRKEKHGANKTNEMSPTSQSPWSTIRVRLQARKNFPYGENEIRPSKIDHLH